MADEAVPSVNPEAQVPPVTSTEVPAGGLLEVEKELEEAKEAPSAEEPMEVADTSSLTGETTDGEAVLEEDQAAAEKANKKAEAKAAKTAAKLASKKDLNFFQRTIKAGGNVARFTLGLPFVPFTYLFKGLGGMTDTEASKLNFFQRTIKAGGNVSRFVFGLPLRLLTGIFRGARGVANTGKK